MEDRTLKHNDAEEEFSDSFLCCVCLELLYKPIVLSCGHISCFWCVHKSMNGLRESHCPICRDPYLHFPSVCQKLHFLLKKLYPLAYMKREEQVLEEEQEQGCFSPQIDAVIDEPEVVGESGCKETDLDISDGEEQKKEQCPNAAKLLSCSPRKVDSLCISSDGKSKASKTLTVDGNSMSRTGKDSEQISTADLLCSACEKLLIHPVVLNCGHVYCQACILNREEENEKIICQVCQALDPRGFPKVCLVLEQFLEERFPEEYTSRRNKPDTKESRNSTTSCSQKLHKGKPSLSSTNDLPWWANPGSNIHIGAGCDSCGIYPIVGDRYRCKDCKEEIGYDLCSECYNSRSKLPGRFNQQHTSDHRLELVTIPELASITRLLDDGTSAIFILPEPSAISDAYAFVETGSDDDDRHDHSAEVHNDSGESSNRNYSRSSSI